MVTQDFRGIGKRNEGDGSVPSGRKIVLKIKIRNPAPVIDRVEDIKTHYCKQCNKAFESGKALGGHMSSAHAHYSGKKVKSRLSETGEKWGWADHECSVCGKEFPSHKSLHGHMRCHPEREWRGMDPPGKNDVMEKVETFNCVDYLLKTWSVKGRRGRWGRPRRIVHPLVSQEDNDLPSRQQLLRMLKWDSKEEQVGDQGLKKRKWDDHRCCPYHMEKTHPTKRQCVDGKEEEESDTESDTIVEAICFLANAKYITPSASAAAAHVDVREIKHICNICNKVFPTHQALGGHKSSHTKVKVSIFNTVDMDKNDNIGNNIVTTHDAKAKGEGDSNICQICRKWFSTARALAGHMRIHSNKGGGRSIGNCIGIGGDGTSIGGGEERVGGVKLLDFDLNIESLDEE